MGADGGLHRDGANACDAGLLAWTVSCLWGGAGEAGALQDGTPRAQMLDSGAEVDALACLPLEHDGEIVGAMGVWITVPDSDAAMRCVSRLTLIGHLWSAIGPAAEDRDVPREALESRAQAVDVLSPRQHDILQAMSEGLTNVQIAQRITFSESTVRLESMAIYRHFGVHSRADAVAIAREWGEL